jgi:DNA-binding MarR family transcriptional regulator
MSTLTNTTTATELAVRLRRTVVRLSRRLRRHAASGLSPSLESALSLIGRRGPLTPSELAEIEDVKRPTATRLIAILERRKLVERAADPCDGRSHRVAVTQAGRALLAASRTRRDAYLGHALSALEPDELAALDRALGLLERLVEDSR